MPQVLNEGQDPCDRIPLGRRAGSRSSGGSASARGPSVPLSKDMLLPSVRSSLQCVDFVKTRYHTAIYENAVEPNTLISHVHSETGAH